VVTMKNVVFWDIKPQFVLGRRHITFQGVRVVTAFGRNFGISCDSKRSTAPSAFLACLCICANVPDKLNSAAALSVRSDKRIHGGGTIARRLPRHYFCVRCLSAMYCGLHKGDRTQQVAAQGSGVVPVND
jgi:hypothetical protein